jgi:hypothetical protein
VCNNDFNALKRLVIYQNWDLNQTVDKQGKYTALTLACHLDKLEVVHLLDILGADLDSGGGKL